MWSYMVLFCLWWFVSTAHSGIKFYGNQTSYKGICLASILKCAWPTQISRTMPGNLFIAISGFCVFPQCMTLYVSSSTRIHTWLHVHMCTHMINVDTHTHTHTHIQWNYASDCKSEGKEHLDRVTATAKSFPAPSLPWGGLEPKARLHPAVTINDSLSRHHSPHFQVFPIALTSSHSSREQSVSKRYHYGHWTFIDLDHWH